MKISSIHFFQDRPRHIFTNSAKKMAYLLDSNLRSWTLDGEGRETLDMICGRLGQRRSAANLASNIAIRKAAGSKLRFLIAELVRTNPGLRVRFGTVISDAFNTKDQQTRLELETVKRVVGQVMAGSGLDGWVGAVELQASAKSYAGVGRDLLGHVHFVLWTRDPTFDLKGLETRLARSRRLSCASGAPTVVFTGSETDAASAEDRLRWVCDRAWYMFKLPVTAKNIVHRVGKKPRAYGCAVQPNLALRLTEILSRIRMDELIMGSGDGCGMANAVRRRIKQVAGPHHSQSVDDEIAAFWAFARRRNGKQLYQPVDVSRWKNGRRTAPYIRGPYKRAAKASE